MVDVLDVQTKELQQSAFTPAVPAHPPAKLWFRIVGSDVNAYQIHGRLFQRAGALSCYMCVCVFNVLLGNGRITETMQ